MAECQPGLGSQQLISFCSEAQVVAVDAYWTLSSLCTLPFPQEMIPGGSMVEE